MPLAYRPHLVTVLPAVEDIDATSLVVESTDNEAPEVDVTFYAQLTVKTTSNAWETYAIQTDFPAFLLFNIEDASKIKMGDRITCVGDTWKVLTEPSKHLAQSVTNHGSCLLEKVFGSA